MIRIGEYNLLKPGRFAPQGLYLQDEQGSNVLLPRKYVPEELDMDALMRVFVYRDHENRPVATTLKPFIELGGFAGLYARQVNDVGAWMDWGLEKDLLVPHREQETPMVEGRRYLIHLYMDDVTDRLVGTSKLKRFLQPFRNDLAEEEEVDLLVWKPTDLGVKVVIDRRYEGLIYRDDIFKRLSPGESLKGYIKTIRPDGKIDVMLELPGYERIEPASQKLLDVLRANGGFLPLHDKSGPEEIRLRLEMSKKTFKKAVGALYKAGRIVLMEDGIRINDQ